MVRSIRQKVPRSKGPGSRRDLLRCRLRAEPTGLLKNFLCRIERHIRTKIILLRNPHCQFAKFECVVKRFLEKLGLHLSPVNVYSSDDVEFIHIDLVGESDSPDESVAKLARKKRKRELRKRFVKRKRQNFIESDDESVKKRVHRKNKRSSDSDFEPHSKRFQKKPKDAVDSDGDSSKELVRKKHKGSVNAYRELKKKKTATKSEWFDSDDEKALSSSVEPSKVAVPRKRKKVTPLRERTTADTADEVDGSANTSNKSDEDLDTDTEIFKSFSIVVPNIAVPRKRKKITPLREKVLASDRFLHDEEDTEEAGCVTDTADENASCFDSDSEKPKSSELLKKAAAKERSPKNEANADDADDGADIPEKSNSRPNSDDNDPVSVDEKPSRSCEKVKAPSDDGGCKNEGNAADKADDESTRVPEKCGFELGYRGEKILGITNRRPDGFEFLVRFRGREKEELVSNDKCKKYCPQLLLEYYEKNIKWKIPE